MRVSKRFAGIAQRVVWWGCWALDKLFYGRLDRYLAWSRYEVGFTGCGPTALDKKPDFPKPWMPGWVVRPVQRMQDLDRKVRQEAWRQTILEVLGEDPDDWGLTDEEFAAKYAKEWEEKEAPDFTEQMRGALATKDGDNAGTQ